MLGNFYYIYFIIYYIIIYIYIYGTIKKFVIGICDIRKRFLRISYITTYIHHTFYYNVCILGDICQNDIIQICNGNK